ncbi:MAG: terminase small subunit [Spirochaetes bacterium]|nr:terminase small subunit [Spirochaetota bacterium]
MAKTELTAKQEMFCNEYLIDLNATQAAIRAKYSKKTAQQASSRLLLNVVIQERISELQKRLRVKTGITAERVIAEFAKIAFANIQDYISKDNEIVDLSEIDKDKAAAVDSIQVDIRHDGGQSKGYTEKIRLKLHSKESALENLGKHLGIYEKDNSQQGMTLADFLKAMKK